MTTDFWYVYNTEMRIYGHMSVKLVFITQATGRGNFEMEALEFLEINVWHKFVL
jgi:hypothetical protein